MMIKNLIILLVAMTTITIACKKDSICTDKGNYNVTGFELQINSKNRGLFDGQGSNTETTIGSIRNQWMFIPEKSYVASNTKSKFSFDLINSAYADCIATEISLTSFDASKTIFSIDRDLDLSIYGLGSEIIPAGTNLLSISALKSTLLKDILLNIDLHAGIEIPISVSKDFLIPLNGEKIKFTLGLVSKVGIEMSSSVDVVINVNA
jgi:hypothetical protein